MITYKKLTIEQAEELYNTYLTHTFPADEVKPFKTLRGLMEKGQYSCFGFYEEDQLTGYAFLCEDKEHTVPLLDYYEIMENRRGQGYGQKIIELLREIYKSYHYLILEVEDPEYAKDEQDLNIRTRRIKFYEKCGLLYAGIKTNVFHVDYMVLLMVCEKEPSALEVREKVIEMYRAMIKEPYFTNLVHVHQPE